MMDQIARAVAKDAAKSKRARAERQIVAAVKKFDAKKAERVAYYKTTSRLYILAAKHAANYDPKGARSLKACADRARVRLNEWTAKRPPVTYSGRAVSIMAGC